MAPVRYHLLAVGPTATALLLLGGCLGGGYDGGPSSTSSASSTTGSAGSPPATGGSTDPTAPPRTDQALGPTDISSLDGWFVTADDVPDWWRPDGATTGRGGRSDHGEICGVRIPYGEAAAWEERSFSGSDIGLPRVQQAIVVFDDPTTPSRVVEDVRRGLDRCTRHTIGPGAAGEPPLAARLTPFPLDDLPEGAVGFSEDHLGESGAEQEPWYRTDTVLIARGDALVTILHATTTNPEDADVETLEQVVAAVDSASR